MCKKTLGDKILQLEKSILEPDTRKNPHLMELMLHPDFFIYRHNGEVKQKNDMISILVEESCIDLTSFDFEVNVVSDEACLVTYKTKRDALVMLRSSLWKFESGQWWMYFHQATILPPF